MLQLPNCLSFIISGFEGKSHQNLVLSFNLSKACRNVGIWLQFEDKIFSCPFNFLIINCYWREISYCGYHHRTVT